MAASANPIVVGRLDIVKEFLDSLNKSENAFAPNLHAQWTLNFARPETSTLRPWAHADGTHNERE